MPRASPDGRKIAFVRNGMAIWVLDLRSGQDRKVTPVSIRAGEPSWSPNGRSLVFAASDSIIRVDADGRGFRKLTSHAIDRFPAWSPDGSLIAFERVGKKVGIFDVTDLYVMKPDGSGQHRIVPDVARFAWSPDGTELAVTRLSVSSSLVSSSRVLNVVTRNGHVKRTISRSHGYWYTPSWSPDGRRIAVDGGDIYVMGSDGTNPHPIAARDDYEMDSAPVWSRDGKRIAFTRYDPNLCVVSGFYITTADGRVVRRVSVDPQKQCAGGYARAYSWLPAGRLVFGGNLSSAGYYPLIAVNAQGADAHRLTQAN